MITRREISIAFVTAALWLAALAAGARALAVDSQSIDPPGNDTGGIVPDMDAAAYSGRLAVDGRATAGTVDHGSFPLQDERALARALEPAMLAELSPDAAEERFKAWLQAAGGERTALRSILPGPGWFQARLVVASDEESMTADSRLGGAYGKAYAQILETLPQVRASAASVERVLSAWWATIPETERPRGGTVAALQKSERWIHSRSQLQYSHRYALDVFFTSVKRNGVAETGPLIRSMSRGIVVASSGDWKGGDTPASYSGGGLSPRAGNGVIVYCPDDGRYYAYFHLASVTVSPGSLVGAGTVLGPGGNTGTNARRKGHGAHVHLEVHEPDGSAWTSYAIRDFILGMK